MRHLFIGKRVLKTTAAVYLTALVCEWMKWPVIFAVIAAIVSMEPTIDASIRKGLIRLPSAAIGAAAAMLFDYLLGQQPSAYALSALVTIYICRLLRWNDALIVATLTSVNMITLTDSNFLTSFFTRLGTTATGIIIAVLVNLFLFPPNYRKNIRHSVPELNMQTVKLTDEIIRQCLFPSDKEALDHLRNDLKGLARRLEQTLSLVSFELADRPYKRVAFAILRELKKEEQALMYMQLIVQHLQIILMQDLHEVSQERRTILWNLWKFVSNPAIQKPETDGSPELAKPTVPLKDPPDSAELSREMFEGIIENEIRLICKLFDHMLSLSLKPE